MGLCTRAAAWVWRIFDTDMPGSCFQPFNMGFRGPRCACAARLGKQQRPVMGQTPGKHIARGQTVVQHVWSHFSAGCVRRMC